MSPSTRTPPPPADPDTAADPSLRCAGARAHCARPRALPSPLLLALALLLLPIAHARAGETLLLDVEGPGAPVLRATLEQALSEGFVPVRGAGLPTQPAARAVRHAARKHAALAVFVVRTEPRAQGALRVTVRVFHGDSGAPLEFLRWTARSTRALARLPDDEAAQLVVTLGRLDPRPAAATLQAAAAQPAPPPPSAAAVETPQLQLVPAALAASAPPPAAGEPGVEPPPLAAPQPLEAAPAAPATNTTNAVAAPSPRSDAPSSARGAPAPAVVPAASASPERSGAPGPVAARLSVGGRLLARRLRYSDDVNAAMPAYRLPGGPALAVGGEWYPGAHLTRGLWANVGVVAAAELLLGVQSTMLDRSVHDTRSHSYRGGLTLRLPLGHRGELGLQGTLGSHGFDFREAEGPGSERQVPGVRYDTLRAALFGRVPLHERVTLVLEAGAQRVRERGELSEQFFPRSSVTALDAALAAQWHLGEAWRLELGATYRRYLHAMHSEPGDRFDVGGALDEYLTGTVALAFELR